MIPTNVLRSRLLAFGTSLFALAAAASGASAQSLPPPSGFGLAPNPPPTIASPQQLLVNGGFESSGPYTVAPGEPWVRAGDMVLTPLPSRFDPYGIPHCGATVMATGGNWGGAYSSYAFAFQQITIPANAPHPVLALYLLTHSSVSPLSFFFANPDSVSVRIASGTSDRSPNTNFASTLATFTTWTETWNAWTRHGNYDLTAFRGQTVQVWIDSSIHTAPPSTTNFSIDDVAVWTQPPVVVGC
jgi:hypothetical protein